MLATLTVTIPFFALVACGWLAARGALLPAQAVPALNAFVLWFALPAMLARYAAQTPFARLADGATFAAYAGVGLVVLAATAAVLRRVAGDGWRDAAFGALGAAWANWGYMGYALVPAVMGAEALAPMIVASMADLLIVVSVAIGLASREGRAGEGALRAVRAALARVARNPLVWAVLAGGALSAAGVAAPKVVDEFLRLLGSAAGPVALFALGAALYRPGEPAGSRTTTLSLVAVKLVVHPLAVWAVLRALPGMSAYQAAALALTAALPTAGTVFVLAERAGGGAARAAAVTLLSTAAAFVTFPLFAALLAPGAR